MFYTLDDNDNPVPCADLMHMTTWLTENQHRRQVARD